MHQKHSHRRGVGSEQAALPGLRWAIQSCCDKIERMTTETPKRKRRWLRFSLRTFLALVLIFGVWLGLLVHRVNKQREAVAWVKEMGGRVLYKYETDDFASFLNNNADPPGPDWLRNLIGLEYFANVSSVYLENSTATDISPLAHLASLEQLFLDGANVADLSPLASLDNLERLSLRQTDVSDITPLAALSNLRELALDDTLVSDLAPLENLTNLYILSLDDTPIKDVTPLAKVTNLMIVDLTGTPVDDVAPLTKLTNLKVLFLDGTQVTKDDNEALRQSLPNCEISP